MPAAFTRCVRRKGKVITIKPKEGVAIPVCYPPGGGSPVPGEVHHVKETESE